MRNLLHKIAHLFKWNYGTVDSYYEGDKLMISFKCTGCGKRSGIHCVDKILDEIIDKAIVETGEIIKESKKNL